MKMKKAHKHIIKKKIPYSKICLLYKFYNGYGQNFRKHKHMNASEGKNITNLQITQAIQ